MILVTGASGLLGSNLVLTGKNMGYLMGAVTNQHPIRLAGVSQWRIDLTDSPAIRKLVHEAEPEVIVHCAAQTNVDIAERDPEATARINVDASRVLARAATDVGSRFVYISTDAVFDGTCEMKDEASPVRPLSVYGHTKYDGEIACAIENPGTLIVRTNIYGWNVQPKYSLAEWMLAKLEANEAFRGFTDIYFCPMLVNDLVDVLFSMLQLNLRGIFHVCGSDKISKHRFGVLLARAFGLQEDKVERALSSGSSLIAKRALDLSMSTRRITSALGHPMPSTEQGLRRFATLRANGFRSELKAMLGE